MIRFPKKILELFYNPKTDSISPLINEIAKAHMEILKRTDFKKSTLTSVLVDDEKLINDFKIPEIGLKKKSILSEISNLFQGVSRWHSPNTMYNAAPPPLLPTVTTRVLTSLYNPNLALHTASGRSLLTEQKVIKAIAEYVGWNRKNAGGVFTWGGKATTIYGIKLGLKNCAPESVTQGIKGNIVVLSTEAGHPSHISDSEWLGIGSANTIRLKTDKNNRVNLQEMDQVIRKVTKGNKKIAAIIISGGTTNDMVVDPIKEVIDLRDKLTKELGLKYTPHVHVDTVVAFPWIFFKDYDFKRNRLNIDSKSIERLSQILMNLKDLKLADSFGIDFHKMGFCPYISSLFMIKEKRALSTHDNGYNWPFFYSMENSRSADGPNSAYVALNVLGIKGFQILIGHLTEIAVHLQDKIEETNIFEVINKTGLGTAVMFIPRLPSGILFKDLKKEKAIRNSYAMEFINKLANSGNPFYIDKIPSNSTGANPFPFTSLKAYIISPFSNKTSNIKFVSFMVNLKKEIDKEFDFYKEHSNTEFIEDEHPLKNSSDN